MKSINVSNFTFEELLTYYYDLDEQCVKYAGYFESDIDLYKALTDRLAVLYPIAKRFVEIINNQIEEDVRDGFAEEAMESFAENIEDLMNAIKDNKLKEFLKDLAVEPTVPVESSVEPTVPVETSNRKRKSEILEEDDVIVVKVVKSKRIVIELLDD